MTTKKATAKPAKKRVESPEVIDAKPVTEAGAPKADGEAYQIGYVGVASDTEDHSVAGQIAKLTEK